MDLPMHVYSKKSYLPYMRKMHGSSSSHEIFTWNELTAGKVVIKAYSIKHIQLACK